MAQRTGARIDVGRDQTVWRSILRPRPSSHLSGTVMPRAVWKYGIGFLRVIGCLIGTSHVIGYAMYASDHSPFMLVPGVALVVLSALPTHRLSRMLWLVLSVAGTVCVAYFVTGLPFLRPSNEPDVRLIFLVEFVLIIMFLSAALWTNVRNISHLLPPR